MPGRAGEAAEKHRLTLRKGAEVQQIVPATVLVPLAPLHAHPSGAPVPRASTTTRVDPRYLQRNRGSPQPR